MPRDSRSSRRLYPAAGRRLPSELRAQRVGPVAETLTFGVQDRNLKRLLEQIDGGPFDAASRIDPYFDGDAALSAMLAGIDSAHDEVLLEAYIFADDPTGERVAEALGRAAQRGAKVRVLADAVGSFQTRREFWRRLERSGARVRQFHPLIPGILWHQLRDHRKILVVDRRMAFTGGMNIADEYSRRRRANGAPPESRRAMRDTHVRVEGSVAESLAAVFAEGWERSGGSPLEEIPGGKGLETERSPTAPPKGDTGDTISVLVVDTRPGRGAEELAATFAAVLGAARRRVWLTMGYFAPHEGALIHLERAAARGCDVRLLLPGPTDVPLVRHAGHARFRRLLASGVRIWEYQPSVLHAKTLVVDGKLSLVGSANLDVRSWRLNGECGLLAWDENLAGFLEEAFRIDLESSIEVSAESWVRRDPLHKIGDSLAGLLTPLL